MRVIPFNQALGLLQTQGRRMVTSMAAAEPQLLFSHFHEVIAKRQEKLRVYCANPGRRYPCAHAPDSCTGLVDSECPKWQVLILCVF